MQSDDDATILNRPGQKRFNLSGYEDQDRHVHIVHTRRLLLTHIRLASICGKLANSADPDQTPQIAASDQGHHCLLAECSITI